MYFDVSNRWYAPALRVPKWQVLLESWVKALENQPNGFAECSTESQPKPFQKVKAYNELYASCFRIVHVAEDANFCKDHCKKIEYRILSLGHSI